MSIIERFDKVFGSGIEFNDNMSRRLRIWSSSGHVGLLKTGLIDDINWLSISIDSIPKDKLYAKHDYVYYLLDYIKKVKKLIQPNKYGFYYERDPVLCFRRDRDVIMIAPIVIELEEGISIPLDSLLKERPSSPLVI